MAVKGYRGRLILNGQYFVIFEMLASPGGYKEDITIDHDEEVELYFSDVSACSMKVRFCLAAAGVPFKERCIKLPSAGSWETKQPRFLKINSAGKFFLAGCSADLSLPRIDKMLFWIKVGASR